MPAKPWHLLAIQLIPMANLAPLVTTIDSPKQFITEIDGNWTRNKLQSFAQGRPQNRFF
jgi:hypothetical protein